MTDQDTFLAVRDVVTTLLGIEDRAETLQPSTPLFGSIPELDSMAVLELISELEVRFGIEVQEEEVTGDVFDTLGSLTDYVDSKRKERDAVA